MPNKQNKYTRNNLRIKSGTLWIFGVAHQFHGTECGSVEEQSHIWCQCLPLFFGWHAFRVTSHLIDIYMHELMNSTFCNWISTTFQSYQILTAWALFIAKLQSAQRWLEIPDWTQSSILPDQFDWIIQNQRLSKLKNKCAKQNSNAQLFAMN